MTPLAEVLHRRIAMSGPLTLADYMAECLLHPEHGYYTTTPVFGSAGDFITAPEISQMFGELLGLAVAQGWLDQGAPPGAVLAEAGPGRGTLMADMLRAMRPGSRPPRQAGFAKALFEDVREDGVRVTLVHPGFVATPSVNAANKDTGKMIQVEDISQMIATAISLPNTACVTELTMRPQRSPYL